ncbi:MAG: hypothetical protein B6I25_02230 [Planctomycetales bacterium 4572_13]|nr:MAG: hypothetical protein B6I25_02230 [Planctomycetales bacterium 4572_13]
MISFDDEEGLDDGGIFVEMKNDAFPAREIVFWHTPFTDTTGWHSMTLSWKQGEDTVIVVDGSVSTVANVRDLVYLYYA